MSLSSASDWWDAGRPVTKCDVGSVAGSQSRDVVTRRVSEPHTGLDVTFYR